MSPRDAILYFGSSTKLALALGVTRVAVCQWLAAGVVPPGRQIRVQELTGGELQATSGEPIPAKRTATATRRPKPKAKAKAKAPARGAKVSNPRLGTPDAAKALEMALAVAKPAPPQAGGAAARLAMLESGPVAQHDATAPQPEAGGRIIAAPIAPRLPSAKPKTVAPSNVPLGMAAWRKTTQGIMAKAKELGVPLMQGDKWGDVIRRIEDAES